MGHWYERCGTPRYTVIGANGVERDTTLRDARKAGWLPSVTTVLGVIAKQQLEDWKVKQGILAALTTERRYGEDDEAFIGRILTDSREQAKKAAEEGTRVHDAIECSFKRGWAVPAFYRPHVEAVHEALFRLFPDVDDWVSEAHFGHPLGYGGKIDLHSPSTGIVVDFKGKDGNFTELDSRGKPKRLIYDQPQQLGGYRQGKRLCHHQAPGAIIFFSRDQPGKVKGEIIDHETLTQGTRVFNAALALWQTLNQYDSRFTHPQEEASDGQARSAAAVGA